MRLTDGGRCRRQYSLVDFNIQEIRVFPNCAFVIARRIGRRHASGFDRLNLAGRNEQLGRHMVNAQGGGLASLCKTVSNFRGSQWIWADGLFGHESLPFQGVRYLVDAG